MKNYITEKEWAALEEALMRAQIPYAVSWDGHDNSTQDAVYYDKYIQIEPVVIQKRVERTEVK
jgi:hypothetical protein